MEIAKNVALVLQALSVTILGLNFAGVRVDSLPRILQPLFLVPWYLYVVFIVGLLAVIITQKEKIKLIGSAPPVPPVLQKVDTIPYQGVTWDIVAPTRHSRENPDDYARRLPTIGEARIPPKCPKCGVPLEEQKGMIYGHIWRCVSCGFKKRSRDPFFTEGGRAEKIWRAKTEAAVTALAETALVTAPDPSTVPKE